ncbi:MAG: DNA recombination protein RmuC, partial [Acidobacteriota bacterium]
VQAYNDTVGSFERRLLPSVRRLEELGAEDAVDAPPSLTRAVRPPTTPERGEPLERSADGPPLSDRNGPEPG